MPAPTRNGIEGPRWSVVTPMFTAEQIAIWVCAKGAAHGPRSQRAKSTSPIGSCGASQR